MEVLTESSISRRIAGITREIDGEPDVLIRLDLLQERLDLRRALEQIPRFAHA